MFAGRVYRRIVRPISLHVGWVEFSGVKIYTSKKLLDHLVPISWLPKGLSDTIGYEATLIDEIKINVAKGDKVVVIGGGLGVTSIVAAKMTGPGGSVVCYEGSVSGYASIYKAIRINKVSGIIKLHNKIVGDPIHVYGEDITPYFLHTSKIPDCDVMELDCEGSEISILKNMKNRPRIIIVETHGLYGSPTSLVKSILQGMDYDVKDSGVAEPRFSDFCKENDIKILVGTYRIL